MSITFDKEYGGGGGGKGGGGGGGGGPDPPPPLNLQSFLSPILLEMKKLVIFHICALPKLYVKKKSILLKVGPPWKNFLDPRLKYTLL